MRTPNGEMKYDNLITFASVMASFPCSNAPGECIFSSLKLIKNEKRPPTKSETPVALVQLRFLLRLSSRSAENILFLHFVGILDAKVIASRFPASILNARSNGFASES